MLRAVHYVSLSQRDFQFSSSPTLHPTWQGPPLLLKVTVLTYYKLYYIPYYIYISCLDFSLMENLSRVSIDCLVGQYSGDSITFKARS
jgi:hypothetical protein